MRRCRPVLLVLFAALAACGQPDPIPAKQAAPPPEPAPPVQRPAVEPSPQVASLAGAWRVAGIDGRSFDEPVGLSLAADEGALWWEPRCAGMARDYRIDGQEITFVSTQPPGTPVCDIGLPPRLEEVMRALDDAASISRTPNNGVLISGPAHSVLLFSQ